VTLLIDGDGTGVQRATGAPITAEELAALWPELQGRVLASLLRSGSTREDAEDVLQEVVLKLMRARLESYAPEDVLPWCLRVARNAAIDLHRRRRPAQPWDDSLHSVPATGVDVPHIVEQRDRLDRVLRCIPQLRDTDQQALLAVAVPGRDRKEAVKHNVRRLRARERLLQMVGAVAAVLAACRRPRVPATATLLVTAGSLLLLLPSDDPVQVELGTSPAPAAEQTALSAAVTTDRSPAALDARAAQVEPVATRRSDRPHRSQQIDVRTPTDQTVLRVVLRDRGPGEEDVLACAGNVPVAGDVCLESEDVGAAASARAVDGERADGQ
jgi:RNA polymerase sigma factor (sigma-70 family)